MNNEALKTHEISNELLKNKSYIPDNKLIEIMISKEAKMQYDNSIVNLYDSVATCIARSVQGFFATIAQGLAYGDGQYAVLSENNALTDLVIKGFEHRLKVANIEQPHFYELLYIDLIKAAQEHTISSEFGQLVIKDKVLTIERTKVIEPKIRDDSKRAKISRIG